jgi:hypothetical protein
MGQLITGVSLTIPDVGGSRAMQQTYMSAHGLGASQTTVQVDGPGGAMPRPLRGASAHNGPAHARSEASA